MFALVALCASLSAQQPYQHHEEMYAQHLTRVNDQFWVSGQPPLKEFANFKARGFKAILNLRLPSEHNAAAEKAEAKRLGLRYFNLPVDFDHPRGEQVTEFLRLTDDPQNRPAFVHCAMATRVTGFWMVRRVLRDGWSVADAEAEANKIGTNKLYLRFARNYITRHPKPPARP